MNRERIRRTLLSAVCAMTLAGCRGTTPIGEILADPFAFDGERVRVEGEVVLALGAGRGGGAYGVDDGTGTLVVLSGRGAPRDGARVRVEGTFQAIATLGDESLGLLREDRREARAGE